MSEIEALKLDVFFPYRLAVLSSTISKAIAQAYEEVFELSIPEWRVIAVLANSPGLSANQIAQVSAMDKVAVSRAVNNLLKNGRISRNFASDDRRRSVLNLSPEGRKIYKRIVPLALSYEQRLLEALSPAEISTLDKIVSKLQTQANDLDNMGMPKRAKA